MNKIIIGVIVTLLICSVMVNIFLFSNSSKPELNSEENTYAEYQELKEMNDEMQKLNLDIYFKVNALTSDINSLQLKIEQKYKDITVEYISREQALASYRQANQQDEIAMQALEEVGENPFGAVLKIKTSSPEETKMIADFVESADSGEVVDRMNYKVH